MNIKDLVTKKQSLEKIVKIVESDKNITLISILKLSKQINFFLERALHSQMLISTLDKKYEIENELLYSENSLYRNEIKSIPKLWIYITEEEKFETNSYIRHEKLLKSDYNNKNDVIIAIGKRAISFAKEMKFNIIYQYEQNNVDVLSKVLPEFIIAYLLKNGFHNVRFIINSSKIKKLYLNVLPINEFELNLENKYQNLETLTNINKLKIFPDVSSFIDSEIYSFLTYITLTLLSESALINQKYTLVAQNKTINDLDDRILFLNKKVIQAKRELEVEQISILSKKKDMLHTVKEGKNEK
ncbi:MSC_0622 family F1-like ATPase gamma subunit [Mycoplasma struthionis]|uniref:F0F1 ATP synthase subunit gamma n=1 Tax=Mycoplasma struthionis TaxID=538220 RepID=A0A3G8LIA9_9MOLU|nr:hypothetical protein [Mycoplasma struthionis]AZG68622.1 hypothetical protein EGN60_01400 [Mycoplasma struthionis]